MLEGLGDQCCHLANKTDLIQSAKHIRLSTVGRRAFPSLLLVLAYGTIYLRTLNLLIVAVYIKASFKNALISPFLPWSNLLTVLLLVIVILWSLSVAAVCCLDHVKNYDWLIDLISFKNRWIRIAITLQNICKTFANCKNVLEVGTCKIKH